MTTTHRLRHQAFYYSSDSQLLDTVTRFVEEGLEEGEPAMVALPEPSLGRLRSRLRERAATAWLVDMREVGRNPACIISAIQDFVDAHPGRRTRMVGEPIWRGTDAARDGGGDAARGADQPGVRGCRGQHPLSLRRRPRRPRNRLLPPHTPGADPRWSLRRQPRVRSRRAGGARGRSAAACAGCRRDALAGRRSRRAAAMAAPAARGRRSGRGSRGRSDGRRERGGRERDPARRRPGGRAAVARARPDRLRGRRPRGGSTTRSPDGSDRRRSRPTAAGCGSRTSCATSRSCAPARAAPCCGCT